MHKIILSIFILVTFYTKAQNNNIEVTFDEMPNEWLKLAVYKGLKTEILDSVKLNISGNGTLKYPSEFKGIGYLISEKNKVLSIVLNQENAKFMGKSLQNPENIYCTQGVENKNFIAYINTFPKYQQANMAWDFLNNMYSKNPNDKNEKKVHKQIVKEQNRILKFEEKFYSKLPQNSFVSQYIPWFKLINSTNYIAQNKPHEIPQVITNLRDINISNEYFYNSGLLQNWIDLQLNLLIKHYGNNERGIAEIRISIDYLLNYLINDENKLNEIGDYLFEKLEQKSLTDASEYLALQLLNQNSCNLNQELAKQLEIYRKMKIGNTAPKIEFNGKTYRNNEEISDVWLNSKFTLIVFGASWCPGCNELMPLLVNAYSKWQKKGMEIILVSLDSDSIEFKKYAEKVPFISTCDFKRWESDNAKNYYIFATPTMFVLDEENTIILRPQHPKQIDDWLKKQNQ